MSSGPNASLSFILGAVLVALVAVLAFVYMGGNLPGENEPEIQIDLPGASNG